MRAGLNLSRRGLPLVLALSALLGTAPLPVQAADVTLENVQFTAGGATYRAPRVIVRDTPQTRAELERFFDPNAAEPIADRVGRLQASEIEIPEITSETTLPAGRQLTTYRDARLKGIASGRIQSLEAANGTFQATGTAKPSSGTFGPVRIENMDLGLSLALFSAAPAGAAPVGANPAALQRIYGLVSVSDLTVTDAAGTTTRIGRLSGRDLMARPTRSGWTALIAQMGATPDLKTASPEDRRRSVDAMTELFDAFNFGSIEAADIRFAGNTADGPNGSVSRILFTGWTPERAAAIRLEGIDAGTKDGRTRIASASVGGLSMAPLLAAMRDSDAFASGKPDPAALRKIIPASFSYRLDGLEVTMGGSPAAPSLAPSTPPSPWGGGGTPAAPSPWGGTPASGAPTTFTLGSVEFAGDKPVQGLPSDLRVSLRNMSFGVPTNSDNAALKQLAEMGYSKVDASFGFNLGWNEAGQELVLKDLTLDGAGMGSATIKALLGNVPKDIFDPDSAVASVAFLGAAARTAEFELQDRGLFERFVAREARRQKRSAEDIRREYGLAATVGIPAILGNSPAAKTLAGTVARFVAKPGRLVVKARAKSPAGYGIADFSASPNPASILEALEITATAE